MRINWDPKKAAKNAKKHKVTFEEAATVLIDPLAVTMEDPDAVKEVRYLTFGTSSIGRLLLVVTTERSDDVIKIISARKATPHERKDYEEGI